MFLRPRVRVKRWRPAAEPAIMRPAMNLLRPVDRDVVANGLKLHLLDWGGDGRTPLVLLHGFTGNAHAWDTLSIALQPHFHVYAVDQRGHGDSDPADVYNPAVSFDDISGIVDQLGLKSFVLVGLSMGGRNGMYYASKRPEKVQKLVIVDIGPEISKRAAQPSSGPPEPDTWESIEQRPDGAIVWKWHPSVKERRSQLDLDWWALLKTITPPTLVLRGESSPILDRDVAERMATELPHGSFVEIPRAVHTLHEDNPEAVVAELKAFLEFS